MFDEFWTFDLIFDKLLSTLQFNWDEFMHI
jgi:hypothetical protein